MIGDPSLAHLLGRVSVVEERIRTLVSARRADDPQPDDPFRGLYLSDEFIDRLLGTIPGVASWSDTSARLTACEQDADTAEAAGFPLRLRELAAAFNLSPLDVDILLVALAPDLDPRFERFFGYLNDDVTRQRPSAALALELCGVPISSAADRARVLYGPLIAGGLVTIEDADRPFPGRSLRVPDRVLNHLLGDDTPDPALTGVLRDPPDIRWGDPGPILHALKLGIRLIYLREQAASPGSGPVLAVQALKQLGVGAVIFDLTRADDSRESTRLAELATREARLTHSGLIVDHASGLASRPALLDSIHADPMPTVVVGEGTWDPAWSTICPLFVDLPPVSPQERLRQWEEAVGPVVGGVSVASSVGQFRLGPEQVARAAASARLQAALTGSGTVTASHLSQGARAENGTALDRLSRHVHPAVGWEDLVLHAPALAALKEVSLRARHREKVLGDWAMRPGAGRGHGVVALFAGDSGTGKTMSAEVVAHDLGLDLYVVDLATVVDKYIGETEKNLERIFSAASGVNGVVLFDEADAVFGKRSEVKDAHDRYANVESAYLLQRIESFDGLAILATNLRANIDEAFTRRLDVIVDFPLPDATHRCQLWERCLGKVERADDVDLHFLGTAFTLAGGGIRAAAVTAAYFAADDGGPVTMSHLITAVQHEYRKLGRLMLASEFGEHWPTVSG